MSRTRTAAAVREVAAPDDTGREESPARAAGADPQRQSLDPATAPVFFEDESSADERAALRGSAAAEGAAAATSRPGSVAPGEAARSRLSGMLDRAGDPVPVSHGPVERSGRDATRRWRYDPHVLGRAVAAVVVVLLLVACAAVAVHVLR